MQNNITRRGLFATLAAAAAAIIPASGAAMPTRRISRRCMWAFPVRGSETSSTVTALKTPMFVAVGPNGKPNEVIRAWKVESIDGVRRVYLENGEIHSYADHA